MYKKILLIGVLLILVLGTVQANFLLDDLVAYYDLDETSGTIATDSTGTYHAIADAADILNSSTGILGTAAQFVTGDTDNILDENRYVNDYPFTINTWVKYATSTNPIFVMLTSSINNTSFQGLGTEANNYAQAVSYEGGGTGKATDNFDMSDNTWRMVTGIFISDTNRCVAMNGIIQACNTTNINYSNTDINRFSIGANMRASPTGYLTGYVDEVGIWDRILTNAELVTLYNSGSGLPYSSFQTLGVTANFVYEIDKFNAEIDFNDTSILTGAIEITDWNWLIDGISESTDQNFSFPTTSYADVNACLIVDTNTAFTSSTCQQFNTGNLYGQLIFNYFDDVTEIGVDEVFLEVDSNAYYSDSNNFQIIDLQGITTGNHSILMQVTGYQEKSFDLNLNQFDDFNYNIGHIESANISEVAFQVFDETGALKPNTSFMGYDNDNNYLIDIKTTDAQGKMLFYLNKTKSDYNFISTDLNFSTTVWTINKPRDATTILEIAGNWKYSITGNSYSSGTNIASDIQKILLQNTTNAYYMKIQDVNEDYTPSSFGLKSVTSEKTKELTPYLYPFGSADLVLIKLLAFATNQPIAEAKELTLSVFTDTNGLIEIGTYVNDSTGTYNIYMDANSLYQLNIVGQTSKSLRPTLSVYYFYITGDSGLDLNNDVPVITPPYTDVNAPAITLQVREYFFGCSVTGGDCYNSMIFSLIFLVILVLGLSAFLTVGSLEQSILIIVLLGMFTFIGFIPLWLFAISAVVSFMWGIFS